MKNDLKLYRIVHYNYTLKQRCDEKYWVQENNGGEGCYVNPSDFKQECLLVCALNGWRAVEKARMFLGDKFLGHSDAVQLQEEDTPIEDLREHMVVM